MSDHSSKCSFSDCDREAKKTGLCHAHYQQKRQHGYLSKLPYRPRGTPPQILYDEVPCQNPALTGNCHVFRGGKREGYGRSRLGNRLVGIHRYIWEQVHGRIEDGLMVDHVCRNRACCNVDHLRLATAKVNATENSVSFAAVNAAKTHCQRGHSLHDAYLNNKGSRVCRQCKHLQYLKRKQAKQNTAQGTSSIQSQLSI